jgi:arylsulfatase A-like enzyme
MQKYTLKFALIVIASGAFYHCDNSENNAEDRKPNIVLILIDDLGKEWISSYGANDITTPNIDALARSGLKFHNVYCMPQCTPSRVTLLTGHYPFRHGWVNHWDVPRWGGGAHFDETMNPSLPREIKKAGYQTCIAGKWQIDDFRVEPDALTRNGFDEYCMWTGYETGIEASANRYHDPYLFTKEGSSTYSGRFGPEVFREFIEAFIHANQDSSFFVYYPMVLPHTPLVNTTDEPADSDLGRHQAMVRFVDKNVGSILNTLDEVGVRDNTLVVLSSDNGTTRGISGTRLGIEVTGAKGLTSETGVCVPFVVSWPAQIEGGSESTALVDFTDLFPTLLEVAGVELESHRGLMDGVSFLPVLLGKTTSAREWILSMGGGNNARLTDQGVENQYRYRDRVLRNYRFKLYVGTDGMPEKFIDLMSDPQELTNLLDSLGTGQRLESLNQLMEVVAKLPKSDQDPIYQPNPAQPWDVPVTAESQVWKK